MENRNKKILVIMTGGTICSSVGEDGKRFSDVESVKIVKSFIEGESPYRDKIDFETIMPLDVLSENLTVPGWNTLINVFKTKVQWDNYSGIIVLHGTDTLAYTSSLLAVLLSGAPIPIIMVSAQLPLSEPGTNGHINFRAAAELIVNGIAPNVYAVYQNSDGVIYLHFGAHLLQCANYSDDFFSGDKMIIENPENADLPGKAFETESMYINKIDELKPSVLSLVPYVGIDYSRYSLEGVKAVVHGTFHSESVCVERKNGKEGYGKFSVLSLLDRCKEMDIPLFLAPCSPTAFKYESTGDALKSGALNIEGTTFEMAYVKTMLGCALGYRKKELAEFVNKSINYEAIK